MLLYLKSNGIIESYEVDDKIMEKIYLEYEKKFMDLLNENDVLIKYLDDIFYGLTNGGGKYQLTTLNDQHYQKKLTELQSLISKIYLKL